MGDEVKITVIATGFKQQDRDQQTDRRERMLAGTTLPTARWEVPIQPRITTPRVEVPSITVPSVASRVVRVHPGSP